MKVVVFPEVNEGSIQMWLDQAGDIYITGTAMGEQGLVLFYVDRKPKASPKKERVWPEEPHCPKCNTLMRVKSNGESGDLFWGCPRYPDCKGTRKFTEADWEAHTGYGSPGEGTPPDDDDIPF